jgi:hypothetical protein
MRQTNLLVSQRTSRNINVEMEERATIGQRVADKVAFVRRFVDIHHNLRGLPGRWMGLIPSCWSTMAAARTVRSGILILTFC